MTFSAHPGSWRRQTRSGTQRGRPVIAAATQALPSSSANSGYRRSLSRAMAAVVSVVNMKEIELRRHTDADGDVLTVEGVEAALEIGARLRGGYSVGISTGAQRATQTLACFL